MEMQLVLFLFFLSILGILWVYVDPRPIRKRLTGNILKACLVLIIVTIPQFLSFFYFPLPNTFLDNVIIFLGSLFFSLGLLLDVYARYTMGKFWGPPGQHDKRRQKKLITEGPFAYTRNPIYLGSFLLLLGLSLGLRSVFFPLVLIHLIYFYKQILIEEKLLEKTFGKEYKNYKSRVPRFLF